MAFDLLSSLIPATLGLTLLGALATMLAPKGYIRTVALLASTPALAATSVMLWYVGINAGGEYQFLVKWQWIPALGIHLEFGVGGLSASLAWLTALLTPLVILYSWSET